MSAGCGNVIAFPLVWSVEAELTAAIRVLALSELKVGGVEEVFVFDPSVSGDVSFSIFGPMGEVLGCQEYWRAGLFFTYQPLPKSYAVGNVFVEPPSESVGLALKNRGGEPLVAALLSRLSSRRAWQKR